jgi:peptidoglycan/LPS O-acetylase OafA/YrhL
VSHAIDKDSRVFGLDALRALAIILVLVAHTWPSKSATNCAGASAVLGVELFFVLSGFLIGGILVRLAETDRLSNFKGVFGFWLRRWFRTLPNYYLFLILHLVWVAGLSGLPNQILVNWDYFPFLQNFTYPQGFFFPQTWSLTIEEWFYLLFPLALFVGLRFFARSRYVWVGVVGLFLVVPSLLRLHDAILMPGTADANALEGARRVWDTVIRKIVVLRLDVVMYGVLGALIARWRPEIWKKMAGLWPLAAVLVITVITSLAWQVPLDAGQPWHGFVLWPLISVGFALLLPRFSQMQRSWGYVGPTISWVARVSYAVYLCHELVILALSRWLGNKSALPLTRQTLPWCIAVWVITFIVADVVYRWFEKPMMNLRDRFGKATQAEAPATPAPALGVAGQSAQKT